MLKGNEDFYAVDLMPEVEIEPEEKDFALYDKPHPKSTQLAYWSYRYGKPKKVENCDVMVSDVMESDQQSVINIAAHYEALKFQFPNLTFDGYLALMSQAKQSETK